MLSIVAVCSGRISVKSNDGSIYDIFQIFLALYTRFESINGNGI